MDRPLNQPPDLEDPAVLAAEAEAMAGGMRQQASMARTGTAMGGHPNPEYLYNRTADILAKCAETIRRNVVPVPDGPPVEEAPAPRKRGRKAGDAPEPEAAAPDAG